jgi:NADPH-dependent 2,4-dienoyl-CoA reductase/sulfur reductase-like enzyme
MTSATELLEADVAVVGAGPAGIAAAACAAESGARVVVVDESPNVGGQIWRSRPGQPPRGAAHRWIERLARSGAVVRTGASVVDAYREGDDDRGAFVLRIEQQGTLVELRTDRLLLATGAREHFLPFPGWTLPGVVGIGGAQALLKAGMDVRGKRVVIAGSGPLLLPVAASLHAAGAHVVFVAEQASARRVASFALGLWRRPAAFVDAVRYRAGFAGAPYRTGWWIREARGEGIVREVVLTNGRESRTMPSDLLCTGYGLVPNLELARLLGCAIDGGVVGVDAAQRTSVAGVWCAGEPTGIGGVDLALVEGQVAGLGAAGRLGEARRYFVPRARLRRMAAAMTRAFAPRDELRALATPETIVCRCEDVRAGAFDAAWSPRQAKLYTRAGMGPCQGRVCGAALAFLYGWPADVVRAPVAPARLNSLHRSPAPTPAVDRGGAPAAPLAREGDFG